ncbi:hypothetical protein [Kribbella yunnanensis]|uniref:hypothetical protein n=1 Tax=Kribbella yunnanensis TaxID=190194 RepID=UPI0031E327FD
MVGRSAVRRNPAVSEALGQALDIVLTHSLQADDLHLLQQDLLEMADGNTARRLAGEDVELVVLAFSVLLSTWQPPRSKARPGQSWEHFIQFVAALLDESRAVTPVIPEVAPFILRGTAQQLKYAKWSGPAYSGAEGKRDQQAWRILARRMTTLAVGTVTAITASPELVPARGPAARLGLLAATVVADMFDDEVANGLRGVHSSMHCLEARRTNSHLASEVMLLVRA